MNIRSLILFGIVLLHGVETFANDGCCSCPECGAKVCIAKPVTKKVKKTVFAVEKKDICIPKIRFPWQIKKNQCGAGSCCQSGCDSQGACGSADCGCAPKCGRVKTVKVLKKKSIECEKCGYEWEIKTVESVPCNTCRPGLGFGRRTGGAACDTSCDQSYFAGSEKASAGKAAAEKATSK